MAIIITRRLPILIETGTVERPHELVAFGFTELLASNFGIIRPSVTTEGPDGYRDVVITCQNTGRCATATDVLTAPARLQCGRTRRIRVAGRIWYLVKNVRSADGYHVVEAQASGSSLDVDATLMRTFIARGGMEMLLDDQPSAAPPQSPHSPAEPQMRLL